MRNFTTFRCYCHSPCIYVD